ncbi:acylneuraminate cytidylyltransferase family protein [bacterium]|nr:acylneuraminate cytidylyltransferase family protein [candidate division CSSED10-310 bacterium]
MKNQTVVIIPARGGSVRVPGKNTRDLNGKPLIAWTIRQAIASGVSSGIFISTDDDRITEIATQEGADIIRRPSALAGPESPSEDALLHALQFLKTDRQWMPETVVMLQCTSPLRRSQDIADAVHLFHSSHCGSVLSVVEHRRFVWNGPVDRPSPVNYDPAHRPRSQDMMPLYLENGSIYVTGCDTLLHSGNRLNPPIRLYLMPEWSALDIDTEQDFSECRIAMRRYREELQF